MADMFNACLAFTLREEGGYVDDPADPGGATNMGITLATYRQWSDDPALGPAEVRDMTLRIARAIYRSLYWNPLRADALPAGVDLSVFDMGVNAGIWRSAPAPAACARLHRRGGGRLRRSRDLGSLGEMQSAHSHRRSGRTASGILQDTGGFPNLWHRLARPHQGAASGSACNGRRHRASDSLKPGKIACGVDVF
jgi:Glycosyl hydrolase 108